MTIAALYIAWSGYIHNSIIIVVFGVGIAVNSLTVALIAIRQRLNKEHDEIVMKFWSSSYRRSVTTEHPGLGMRTLIIVLVTLVPFLLTILVLLPVNYQSMQQKRTLG